MIQFRLNSVIGTAFDFLTVEDCLFTDKEVEELKNLIKDILSFLPNMGTQRMLNTDKELGLQALRDELDKYESNKTLLTTAGLADSISKSFKKVIEINKYFPLLDRLPSYTYEILITVLSNYSAKLLSFYGYLCEIQRKKPVEWNVAFIKEFCSLGVNDKNDNLYRYVHENIMQFTVHEQLRLCVDSVIATLNSDRDVKYILSLRSQYHNSVSEDDEPCTTTADLMSVVKLLNSLGIFEFLIPISGSADVLSENINKLRDSGYSINIVVGKTNYILAYLK